LGMRVAHRFAGVGMNPVMIRAIASAVVVLTVCWTQKRRECASSRRAGHERAASLLQGTRPTLAEWLGFEVAAGAPQATALASTWIGNFTAVISAEL